VNQPFEIHDAIHLRRNKWITVVCAAPWIVALIGVVTALIADTPAFAKLTPHLVTGGIVGFIYAWRKNPRAHRVKATVRAGSEGVQIDSASAVPFLPRAHIQEGFVFLTETGTPRVRLMRSDLLPPVDLEVGDETDGRGLLRALGLDVSQKVASFRLSSQLMAKPKWNRAARVGLLVSVPTLYIVSALLGSPVLALVLVPLTFALFLVARLMPSWLDVGADGVLITWFWYKRFIAYSNIELVTPFDHDVGSPRVRGLLLTLRSGEQIWVPVARRSWDNERVAIIHDRIREAMANHKQGDTEAFVALLRRGERSVGAWITMLRSLGTGANADHRIAPVAPERLWRIVADSSAPMSARAAAAVALAAAGDDEGRDRLEAIAGATVAPKLRIALKAAAGSAEEAALEEALGELEATDTKALSIKVG
jgi:hypothetical protein